MNHEGDKKKGRQPSTLLYTEGSSGFSVWRWRKVPCNDFYASVGVATWPTSMPRASESMTSSCATPCFRAISWSWKPPVMDPPSRHLHRPEGKTGSEPLTNWSIRSRAKTSARLIFKIWYFAACPSLSIVLRRCKIADLNWSAFKKYLLQTTSTFKHIYF